MGLPLWYNNRRELGFGPIHPADGGAGAADAARCACYTRTQIVYKTI